MAKGERIPVLDSQKILEFDFTYFTRSDIEFDPYTLIFERGGELVRIARSMRRKYANQYRKFDVGATSISVNPRRSRAASFLGACWKPT